MNYFLYCKKDNGNNQYTYYLLKHLIEINGHKITEIEKADFILFSICDVTQISQLKYYREKNKNKKIITGGHFSVFFKLLILFSDYVNVGQGFEFFKCKNENEIRKLECIYFEGKKEIIKSSALIEWEKVPICKITKNSYYYWGSVGCKNRCSFCLTSWTNRFQTNNINRIKKAITIKKNVSIISNDNYQMAEIKENGKSIKLKEFNKISKHYCNYYRIGLEFATEENRKKTGKFFTNKELYIAIQKACSEKVRIQFFCISGLDTKNDWQELINNIPDLNYGWGIYFKFTNLEYQMFTPMYKERFNIKIENYMTKEDTRRLFKDNQFRVKPLRIRTIKYPAHALYRSALSSCTTKEQFNLIYDLRNEKDIKKVYDIIQKSKALENDYSTEIVF